MLLKEYINATSKVREEFCFPYNQNHSEQSLLEQIISALMFSPVLTSRCFQNAELDNKRFQGNKRKRPTYVSAQVSLIVRLSLLACHAESIQSSQLNSVINNIKLRISLASFSQSKYFLVVYSVTAISIILYRNSFDRTLKMLNSFRTIGFLSRIIQYDSLNQSSKSKLLAVC